MDNNIRDENYYTIHGWMINRLGLKGVQLSVYAIIYGFSQDGENEYRGRIQYLCDFTGGTSKPTIIKALKELVEKGYLQKREEVINGVLFVRYRAIHPADIEGSKEILPPVKKFNGGSKEILPPPGKKILPPTLHNNNIDIPIDRESENSPDESETGSEMESEISPKEIVELFNQTCPSLPPVQYITSKRSAAIKRIHAKYTTDKIHLCFEIAESSEFLKGKNDRGWKATFDWLIDPDNMAKVLEGNYSDDSQSPDPGNERGSFETEAFYHAAVAKSLGEDPETA